MKRLFDGANGERTKDVIPLNADDFFSPGGLSKKVDRKASNPLNNDTSRESVLESQFRSVSAEYPPRELIPQSEPQFNIQLNVNRSIYPVSEHAQSIGQFELGLLYKKSEGFMDMASRNDPFTMANRPAHILNPVTFNAILNENQIHLIKKDPKAYYQMSAWDFWKQWSVDGVVTHIRGMEDGMIKSIEGPQQIKRATLSTKGANFIHNYWAESNPLPGFRCYMIFKKYDKPSRYTLDSHSSASSYKTPNYNNLSSGYEGKFKPFQIGFFCMPHRGTVPLEMKTYTDEWGYEHHDGLIIYIGTVLTAPRRVIPHYADGYSEYNLIDKPCTDWNIGHDSSHVTMMKIILDPNDGIIPL